VAVALLRWEGWEVRMVEAALEILVWVARWQKSFFFAAAKVVLWAKSDVEGGAGAATPVLVGRGEHGRSSY
jgi:hypothetical protein